MNQSDLARLFGIKPQAAQHWERGATQFKTTRIHELAEILKVKWYPKVGHLAKV